MRNQGYRIPWAQMPVIDQDSPSTVFTTWEELAASDVDQGYMPQLPKLSRFQIIGEQPISSPIGIGASSVVLGDFYERGVR